MKKIFFALAALAMVVFASCSKDEDSEPSSSEIQLNITVADIGPDEPVTRAASIKDVWAEGDQIYIWYDDNTGDTPDLVITYDGNEWIGPEDIKAPAGESGYVKCLYDGRVKVASKVNYTYTSSPSNRFKRTLSFKIESWTCLTEVVVVVTDIPEGTDASLYTLACDKFTPLSGNGYVVGEDAITVTKGTKGATATGFASDVYDDAVAFAFATADYSSNAQDFEFTLATTTGTKAFSENLTLEPSDKIKSVTLAYSDFAATSTDHEAVQLWEGGPYWATNNIGAQSETEAGYYFAWGYPDGYVRNSANNGWVKADDSSSSITFNASGFPDYQTHTYSDMAAANWGADWKVPEKADFENLLTKCDFEYVTTGTKGVRFKGKGSYSGNSIFFPGGGYGNGSDLENESGYWSCTQSDEGLAHFLYIPAILFSKITYINSRCRGYSVRPVRVTGPVPVTAITLSKTETRIAVSQTEMLSVSGVEPSIATVHVIWSSSDPSVATVDASTGKVTGIAEGTATITATADDGVKATCTVTVVAEGSYVTVNGQGGVVYFYDSKPYIISLDEKKCNWSDAQKWCEEKGDSWYIPKVKELKAIYNVKATLNATLSSNGGTELSNNDYWASNEASTNREWYVDLKSGIDNYTAKTANLRVRAVRAL